MKPSIELASVKPFKDLIKEPKVRPKSEEREATHTIALVPTNYVYTLWPDVRDHLGKAVARSTTMGCF